MDKYDLRGVWDALWPFVRPPTPAPAMREIVIAGSSSMVRMLREGEFRSEVQRGLSSADPVERQWWAQVTGSIESTVHNYWWEPLLEPTP